MERRDESFMEDFPDTVSYLTPPRSTGRCSQAGADGIPDKLSPDCAAYARRQVTMSRVRGAICASSRSHRREHIQPSSADPCLQDGRTRICDRPPPGQVWEPFGPRRSLNLARARAGSRTLETQIYSADARPTIRAHLGGWPHRPRQTGRSSPAARLGGSFFAAGS
jgi:hypothetical protein